MIQKLEYNKIKKLFSSKDTLAKVKKKKRQAIMWERIFATLYNRSLKTDQEYIIDKGAELYTKSI